MVFKNTGVYQGSSACGRARRPARQASKTASKELDWVEMRVASDAIVSHSHAKDSPALLGAAGWGDTRCHVVGEGPEAQRQVLHLDVLFVVRRRRRHCAGACCPPPPPPAGGGRTWGSPHPLGSKSHKA